MKVLSETLFRLKTWGLVWASRARSSVLPLYLVSHPKSIHENNGPNIKNVPKSICIRKNHLWLPIFEGVAIVRNILILRVRRKTFPFYSKNGPNTPFYDPIMNNLKIRWAGKLHHFIIRERRPPTRGTDITWLFSEWFLSLNFFHIFTNGLERFPRIKKQIHRITTASKISFCLSRDIE